MKVISTVIFFLLALTFAANDVTFTTGDISEDVGDKCDGTATLGKFVKHNENNDGIFLRKVCECISENAYTYEGYTIKSNKYVQVGGKLYLRRYSDTNCGTLAIQEKVDDTKLITNKNQIEHNNVYFYDNLKGGCGDYKDSPYLFILKSENCVNYNDGQVREYGLNLGGKTLYYNKYEGSKCEGESETLIKECGYCEERMGIRKYFCGKFDPNDPYQENESADVGDKCDGTATLGKFVKHDEHNDGIFLRKVCECIFENAYTYEGYTIKSNKYVQVGGKLYLRRYSDTSCGTLAIQEKVDDNKLITSKTQIEHSNVYFYDNLNSGCGDYKDSPYLFILKSDNCVNYHDGQVREYGYDEEVDMMYYNRFEGSKCEGKSDTKIKECGYCEERMGIRKYFCGQFDPNDPYPVQERDSTQSVVVCIMMVTLFLLL